MLGEPLDRREFIEDAALSVAFLAGASFGDSEKTTSLESSDIITLGRSKLLASRQGLGLGNAKAPAFQEMGQAGFTCFIRHALDQGIRYFDLLPGPAHTMMATALKGVPRENYTLVTNFRHPEETDPAKMIDRYLRELQTEYLDGILAGGIVSGDWAKEEKWAVRRDLLSTAKEKGKIKAHGVSVHGWEALKSLARDSWVEMALVSCNHVGTWMNGPTGTQLSGVERRNVSIPLIKDIHDAEIGTSGMKVFSHTGYVDAENPPQERLRAIRYVMKLGLIDTMPIQCESIEEFDEVSKMINQVGRGMARGQPLSNK
jgi:hypothetical protein